MVLPLLEKPSLTLLNANEHAVILDTHERERFDPFDHSTHCRRMHSSSPQRQGAKTSRRLYSSIVLNRVTYWAFSSTAARCFVLRISCARVCVCVRVCVRLQCLTSSQHSRSSCSRCSLLIGINQDGRCQYWTIVEWASFKVSSRSHLTTDVIVNVEPSTAIHYRTLSAVHAASAQPWSPVTTNLFIRETSDKTNSLPSNDVIVTVWNLVWNIIKSRFTSFYCVKYIWNRMS